MSEEQPNFKVVDRRPFNPDGSPRELSAHDKEEADRAAKAAEIENAAARAMSSQAPVGQVESPRRTARPQAARESAPAGDPLDDPASFLSLVMSLASLT